MNMMRYAILAGGLAVAACGLAGPAYPNFGETPFRIEGTTTPLDGGPAAHTVIYRDGAKLRVETALADRGQAVIVFDEATGGAYMLNPVVVAANTATTPAPLATAPNATPAPTAPPPSVVGVAVRIPDTDAPQPLETPWAALGANNARSTGGCVVANEHGNEWQARATQKGVSARTACITQDGIVLRVREGERVVFEATSLQRGPLDTGLFGVPAGYQKIDPEAVGDRVSNAVGDLDTATSRTQSSTAPPRR